MRIVISNVRGIPVYKVMDGNKCLATCDTHKEARNELESILLEKQALQGKQQIPEFPEEAKAFYRELSNDLHRKFTACWDNDCLETRIPYYISCRLLHEFNLFLDLCGVDYLQWLEEGETNI